MELYQCSNDCNAGFRHATEVFATTPRGRTGTNTSMAQRSLTDIVVEARKNVEHSEWLRDELQQQTTIVHPVAKDMALFTLDYTAHYRMTILSNTTFPRLHSKEPTITNYNNMTIPAAAATNWNARPQMASDVLCIEQRPSPAKKVNRITDDTDNPESPEQKRMSRATIRSISEHTKESFSGCSHRRISEALQRSSRRCMSDRTSRADKR